ncbi:MFS transporter [Sphingomonas xinjiangensis]|uniref:MFS family permease n=1 Tax=Sphingomonas xinjiangensis TaxID=643568 RepID=A0A840YDS2_9SPHN|nr:MFS transporter [Sphingomonas xinjiangensis]MBB5710994.1 MFS family permease [Sphingomonas xinjiangensis]
MPDVGQATVRRVTWRLMPFLGLLYMIAYIDRQNISYAKLQMVDALGLSEAAYGLGASLFFIGYFLFEVPSNLLLHRVGAHVWFTRIMATWGIITVLLAFTPNPTVFYLLRFLLGVAEAGFFPGVLYVLTLWFPVEHRARAVGLFMLASAVANAVGAAIGGLLLDQDGTFGLAGWQWVFLATGLPAVALAPAVFFLLPRGPEAARWLSTEQKAWLASTLDDGSAAAEHGGVLSTLRDRRVLLLCLVYIGFPLAAYGLSYWLPTIVKSFGVSNTTNGLLNIIPWTLVGLALWGVPRMAARFRNQVWFAAGPALAGAMLLVLSVLVTDVTLRFALLSLAAAAIFSGQPVFWTLPPRFLSGAHAAAGFAAVNSVGNLGGFVAQAVVPTIRDRTGSDIAPMLFLAVCLAAAGLGVLAVERMLPRPR